MLRKEVRQNVHHKVGEPAEGVHSAQNEHRLSDLLPGFPDGLHRDAVLSAAPEPEPVYYSAIQHSHDNTRQKCAREQGQQAVEFAEPRDGPHFHAHL